ncbi:MAG: PTS sugar transporter subunit IIB [Gemmatimonadales bacterium]|nr:PTS sugar transporter subunit IIB [Gemmatimonadales bacterium]
MGVALYRVDDRLVHGQVVIGWGRPLGVRFIALVDPAVRASSWEQDLYRMAVPDGVEVFFADVAEAITLLPEWEADRRAGVVITGDLETMAALYTARPDLVNRINLGGIHHRADRTERLRYLYLAPEEEALLRRLDAAGAELSAQDLPTTPAVPLDEILP